MREQGRRDTKARVLFTGSGARMMEDLMEDISDLYHSEKCEAREKDFSDALEKVAPHTVVLCLQDEQRENMRTYFPLEDHPRHRNTPVLVIGYHEDCELFKKTILVKNLSVMERPLDIEGFLSTLDELAEKGMAQERERGEVRAPEKEPAKEELELPQQEKMSVLVVDDDVRMLNVIKLYLQDHYDVTVVPNGKLALKFLAKKHADLVLLDYMMPEMDGVRVLEEIRTNCPEPQVPVLFLSGVSDREQVLRTLEYKPNGYLLKPATREELLDRVNKILFEM